MDNQKRIGKFCIAKKKLFSHLSNTALLLIVVCYVSAMYLISLYGGELSLLKTRNYNKSFYIFYLILRVFKDLYYLFC